MDAGIQPWRWLGERTRRWVRRGRRTAARGDSAPAGGLSSGDAPPISLLSCQKRNGPCTVQREKRWRAPVQWPSARDGGRRIGACSDFALPSGTLQSSAVPPTAVPWWMVPTSSGCKDAFDLLLFPRVPLRYALLRRAQELLRWFFAEASSTTRPAAAKREAAQCVNHPDAGAPSAMGRQYRPRRRV